MYFTTPLGDVTLFIWDVGWQTPHFAHGTLPSSILPFGVYGAAVGFPVGLPLRGAFLCITIATSVLSVPARRRANHRVYLRVGAI